MRFKVILTENAALDLEDIINYIARNDSQTAAASVLTHFEKAFKHLEIFPMKGSYPKELAWLGVKEFRETHFKPYRIIYRVTRRFVYIELIADGRRNMQTLLTVRLLER